MTFQVVPCPRDALVFTKFLDHLQSANKHALGFLPWQAFTTAIESQCVFLCYENDEPAGYLIHGKPKKLAKIYQVCICDDSRRVEHGTALIDATKKLMDTYGVHELSLYCADDLPANSFWKEIGFTKVSDRCRRKDGKRRQNRYQIDLPQKEIDRLSMMKQLETDGLTKLRKLLLKGDVRHANVRMSRKTNHKHEIYLPTVSPSESPNHGTS